MTKNAYLTRFATIALLAGTTAGLTACSGNEPQSRDGGCATACTPPANGTATCTEGTCFATCNAPYTLCGSDCVDVTSSSTDCGSCGNACPNGGACTDGGCGSTSCTSASSCAHASTCTDNCGANDPTLCSGMQCSTTTACQDTCGLADDTCTTGCDGGMCSNGACASCTATSCASPTFCQDNCGQNNQTVCGGQQCSTTVPCQDTCGLPDNSCATACPSGACSNGSCAVTCTPTGCSKITACQDNCGNTNNACATGCDPNNPGNDNCGQPSTSCGAGTDGGTCTPAGCNAFVACEDTCGNADNSCPTACDPNNPGMDNCGQANPQCTAPVDGGSVCVSLTCNPLVACQDNCGNADTSCYTACDTTMPGYDNCGMMNPACGTYAMGIHHQDSSRKHETVLLPSGTSATIPFRWHDAPGLTAPADLSVEMAGQVIMQVSSVSARPFVRSGVEVATLDADVSYRIELNRHDHVVTVKITRDGTKEVLFQADARVLDSATAADVILAESFRRSAVTLEH